MQPGRFGQMRPHPPRLLSMGFRFGFDAFAVQAETVTHPLRPASRAFTVRGQKGRTPVAGVTLHSPPKFEYR